MTTLTKAWQCALIVTPLLVVSATGNLLAQPQTSVRPISLRTDGRAEERPIKGGDAQTYRLKLKSGEYCAIAVTQSAIDLAVTLNGPDGTRIAEVNTPHRTTGDEVVEIVAAKAGLHVLAVRPVEGDAEPGSLRVRVTAIRSATDAERRRVAALRVFERAENARAEGTAASLDRASQAYEEALALFRANGDRREIARALLGTAHVIAARGYVQLTDSAYLQAAAAFKEAGDVAGEAEALGSTNLESQDAALATSRRIGDRMLEAFVLTNRASSLYWSRKYADAKVTAEQSASIFKELHNGWGYGRARTLIGKAVLDLETARDAIPYFEEVLAWAERAHDLDLQASVLGNIGWALKRGEPEKALAAYARGVEAARQSGSKLAEAWQTVSIGQIYSDLGQRQQALSYLQRGLALTKEAGAMMDYGATLESIGQVYSVLGDREKALEYAKQGLEVFQKIGDRQEEAVQLLNLGHEYERLGNSEEALTCYTRALDILKELGNLQRQGWTLRVLADYYTDRADYSRALEMYQQALDASRAAGDVATEIHVITYVADVRRILGEPQRALESYGQALDAARRHGLKIEEIAILIRLGSAYNDQGEYDKARERYIDALSLLRNGSITAPSGEAAALEGLATTRRTAGDNAGSVAAFEEALTIATKVKDRPHQIGTMNGLGQTLVATGNVDRAVSLYSQALQLARDSRMPAAEGVALGNLMSAWRIAGRPQLAVFYGKQAVNILQTVRAGILVLEPQTQRAYLRSKEQVYRELADLLVAEGRLPEAQQVLGFLKQEEFREYIRGSATEGPSRVELTPEEAAVEQRYRDVEGQLLTLARRQAELSAKRSRSTAEESELTQLDADLKIAARHYQTFLDSLATEFAAASDGNARVFQLREAQGLMSTLRELGPGTVALYTIVGEQRYSVILITPEVQKAATFGITAADLARKVLALREALQNPRSDPRPLAHELYQILVDPVAKDLEQAHARTLMWALDGVLRYVPFSALYDGRRYLVERYRSSVFTPASDANIKDAVAPWRSGLGLGVTKAQPGFEPLPDAAGELRSVIKDPAVGSTGVLSGHLLLDEAFTEPALRAELGRQPPVVHVASHFQFRPGNEGDSFLLLGDGRHLSVGELRASWNFFKGVDLLTLSACDTAVGGAGATGKEVESFGVLAQRNGAKAVIASLWPVADASTRLFMERFYRARTQKMSKAEALQAAQLALLHGDSAADDASRRTGRPRSATANAPSPYAHPFYWAPFLLIGNWR